MKSIHLHPSKRGPRDQFAAMNNQIGYLEKQLRASKADLERMTTHHKKILRVKAPLAYETIKQTIDHHKSYLDITTDILAKIQSNRMSYDMPISMVFEVEAKLDTIVENHKEVLGAAIKLWAELEPEYLAVKKQFDELASLNPDHRTPVIPATEFATKNKDDQPQKQNPKEYLRANASKLFQHIRKTGTAREHDPHQAEQILAKSSGWAEHRDYALPTNWKTVPTHPELTRWGIQFLSFEPYGHGAAYCLLWWTDGHRDYCTIIPANDITFRSAGGNPTLIVFFGYLLAFLHDLTHRGLIVEVNPNTPEPAIKGEVVRETHHAVRARSITLSPTLHRAASTQAPHPSGHQTTPHERRGCFYRLRYGEASSDAVANAIYDTGRAPGVGEGYRQSCFVSGSVSVAAGFEHKAVATVTVEKHALVTQWTAVFQAGKFSKGRR